MGAALATGAVAEIIKALSCDSCAKYCMNGMDCESECCDSCRWHYHTEAIPIEHDDI